MELAERVLLPGDPHRALAIATHLLEDVRMFNQRRALWGYTGRAPDGGRVTVQATGMGGPSAAIVAEEAIDLGATALVRIGTCGALSPELALGELLAVEEAIGEDGTSRALGAPERVRPDAELTERLAQAGPARRVVAVTTDLFYDPRPGREDAWREAGAAAVEMEAAAVFAVGARRGVPAACLLAVTDLLAGGRVRIDGDGLEEVGLELGRAALRALAAG